MEAVSKYWVGLLDNQKGNVEAGSEQQQSGKKSHQATENTFEQNDVAEVVKVANKS